MLWKKYEFNTAIITLAMALTTYDKIFVLPNEIQMLYHMTIQGIQGWEDLCVAEPSSATQGQT